MLLGLLAGIGFTATSRQAPEEQEEALLETASEQTRSIVALRRWLLGRLCFDNQTFREGDASSFFVQCTLSRKGRFENVEVLRCPMQGLGEQVVALLPKAPTPSPRPCGPDGRPADIGVAFDVEFVLKAAQDGTLRAVDRYTYAEADVPPTFLKGDANQFYVWLSRQIAGSLRVDSLRGCIDMAFTVEDDGSVSNPRVVGESEVELAAKIRDIVLTSPRWEPARILDQAVRVQLPLYIDFGPVPENENPDSCSVKDGGHLDVFPLFKGGDLNAFRQWMAATSTIP